MSSLFLSFHHDHFFLLFLFQTMCWYFRRAFPSQCFRVRQFKLICGGKEIESSFSVRYLIRETLLLLELMLIYATWINSLPIWQFLSWYSVILGWVPGLTMCFFDIILEFGLLWIASIQMMVTNRCRAFSKHYITMRYWAVRASLRLLHTQLSRPGVEVIIVPWNHSPPSIDLLEVSMIPVACRDDSLPHSTIWTIAPGTAIPTTLGCMH